MRGCCVESASSVFISPSGCAISNAAVLVARCSAVSQPFSQRVEPVVSWGCWERSVGVG
eukprot:COSAG02_NODE_66765_length_254_cov_1.283871_1_plen_58_part_01